MKTNYKLLLSFLILLCATLFAQAQTTIYTNNFESNGGSWTDGGNRCDYVTNDSYSPQGNNSWRLRGDNGDNSAFFQDFDLSGYSEMTISFSFKSKDFDDDDDRFEVLIDDNRVEEYRYNRDGWDNNNTKYTRSITIYSEEYSFNTSTEIKFETTKDTGDSDYLYIDEIEITVPDASTNTLFFESFENENEDDTNGTDANNVDWYTSTSGANPDKFQVRNGNYFESEKTQGEAKWYTETINIAGYTNLELSSHIDFNRIDSQDYIKFQYKLDGGSAVNVPDANLTGNNTDTIYNWPLTGVTGSTLEIIILFNTDDDNDRHRIDNVKLTGTIASCSTDAVTLPWTEDFETATTNYTEDNSDLDGLCNWGFEQSGTGRVRFDEVAHNGSKAALLDAVTYNTNTSVNSLIKTLNLSNYSANTDLYLSFWYATYGDQDHDGDKVWIRGSNTDTWVVAYNLLPESQTIGTWNHVTNLNIYNILSANSQTITSTFQIKLGQEDRWRYTNDGAVNDDGIAFDDIEVMQCTAPSANFTADATTIDQNNPVVFTNTSTGTNNTYTWDFGDATGTSTDTNPTYTYTVPGTYTVTLTATNNCGTTTKTETITVNLSYCDVVETDTSYDDGITSVEFGSIDNQTSWEETGNTATDGITDGYIDYTNLSTTVERGSSENLIVKLRTDLGGNPYTYYATAWIDWNIDGVFNESNERYDLGYTTDQANGSTTNSPLTINIPNDAVLGTTRMRIISRYNSYPTDACTDINYGEIEDYTIVIEAAPIVPGLLAIQDFDGTTPEWTYTTNSNGTIGGVGFGGNTSNSWGVQGNSSGGDGTITFDEITIDSTYYEDLNFTFDYYLANGIEGPGQNGQDYFNYSIYYNSNTTADVTEELITSSGNDTWNSKTIQLPTGTTSIKVVFNYSVNYPSNDLLGLDNVKLKANTLKYFYTDGVWAPSAPENINDADIYIVSGVLDLIEDFTCKSMTIYPAGAVTTTTNTTLTATSKVTLNSESNQFSSLILNGALDVAGETNGEIEYNRWVNNFEPISEQSPSGNGNDVISSPVTGQMWSEVRADNQSVLYNNGTLYSFTPYNNGYNSWGSLYTNTSEASIETGKGYRVATFNGSSAPVKFTGKVNKDNISVTIRNINTRWNVVGNPYPSYISLYDFIDQNEDILDTDYVGVYGYNGVENTDGWVYYNKATALANNVMIAPGQGFYVAAITDNQTLTFTPTMRRTSGNDDFLVGRSAGLNISEFKLNLSNGTLNRESQFYFIENSTNGFDLGFDTNVFNGNANFNIYSKLVEDTTNQKLAIQTMPSTDLETMSIPLGVHAQQGQELVFSLENVIMPEGSSIYLEDRETNTWTLLTESNYIITVNQTLSGTGRFYIHSQNNDVTLSTNSFDFDSLTIKSIHSTKELVIKGQLDDNNTQLSVYDINGRLVIATTLDASKNTNRLDVSNYSTGVYVVRLANSTQNKTLKVVIKN